MPMISIDRATGALIWGDAAISTATLATTLVAQYSEAYVSRQVYDGLGLLWRMYHLPPVTMRDQKFSIRLHYLRDNLSGIGITYGDSPPPLGTMFEPLVEEPNDEPFDERDELQQWLKRCLKWTDVTKQWLTEQLGNPDTVSNADLRGVSEFISDNERRLLADWEYCLEWGKIHYRFDWMEFSNGIGVSYTDRYPHITDWDGLVQEYESAIEFDRRQGGQYTLELISSRNLVTELREHFDFHHVQPTWSAGEVVFKDEIRVVLETQRKRYRISHIKRSDFYYAESVAELINLLQDLLSK